MFTNEIVRKYKYQIFFLLRPFALSCESLSTEFRFSRKREMLYISFKATLFATLLHLSADSLMRKLIPEVALMFPSMTGYRALFVEMSTCISIYGTVFMLYFVLIWMSSLWLHAYNSMYSFVLKRMDVSVNPQRLSYYVLKSSSLWVWIGVWFVAAAFLGPWFLQTPPDEAEAFIEKYLFWVVSFLALTGWGLKRYRNVEAQEKKTMYPEVLSRVLGTGGFWVVTMGLFFMCGVVVDAVFM